LKENGNGYGMVAVVFKSKIENRKWNVEWLGSCAVGLSKEKRFSACDRQGSRDL
jgi:hypothetical protein